MTRRHPTQRRLTFAALTGLAAAGVLLPTTAFATPQAPHPGTATTVVSAVQTGHGSARPGVAWVNTTDSPSGITIRLPGKAEVQKFTVPTGAKSINGRLYMVETADNVVAVAYAAAGTSPEAIPSAEHDEGINPATAGKTKE